MSLLLPAGSCLPGMITNCIVFRSTLGNGKENGYEDNKRQGDFGFTC